MMTELSNFRSEIVREASRMRNDVKFVRVPDIRKTNDLIWNSE